MRIVAEPGHTAAQYRRLIAEAASEYLEFSRPPYAVDPLDEDLVKQACERGVRCRILVEAARSGDAQADRLHGYRACGVEVRRMDSLPMKLALFDGARGMIALLDPLVTKPNWTAVQFDHPGMAQAMHGLFEDYWRRSSEL